MTHCAMCGQHSVDIISSYGPYLFRGKMIEVKAEISHCTNCQFEFVESTQLEKLYEICLRKYEEEE